MASIVRTVTLQTGLQDSGYAQWTQIQRSLDENIIHSQVARVVYG